MGLNGCFFPVKNINIVNIISIPCDKKLTIGHGKETSPFFVRLEDENTVKLFLEAIVHFKHDDAKAYLSKNYAKDFDLFELSDFFNKMNHYKNLIKIDFIKTPKNCKTNSILVMNGDKNGHEIIHLHLIKEPDSFSKWKIYGIDRE